MKRFLKSPALNAVCVSLFSAFYALVFTVTAYRGGFTDTLYYAKPGRADAGGLFWAQWSRFLAEGRHQYIAYALTALTAAVVVLLLTNRRPYDEYHVDILLTCLVAALVVIMAGIAVFYFSVLREPEGVVERFTLFVVIHWLCVVLADLAYVLLCRRR
jgi:hypothetical protein